MSARARWSAIAVALAISACGVDPASLGEEQAAATAMVNVALDGAASSVSSTPESARRAIDGNLGTAVEVADWQLRLSGVTQARFVTVLRGGVADSVELFVDGVSRGTVPIGRSTIELVDPAPRIIELVAPLEATFTLDEVEVWAVVPDAGEPDGGADDACTDRSDFDRDGIGDRCDSCPYQFNPEQGACLSPPRDDDEAAPPAVVPGDDGGGCSAGGASGLPAAMLVAFAVSGVARRRGRRHR